VSDTVSRTEGSGLKLAVLFPSVLCRLAQGKMCRGLACVLFWTRCRWHRPSPPTHRMFAPSDGSRAEQQRDLLLASCLNCFD
jgi:hypothetical protein